MCGRFWQGNYLWKQFRKPECDWMIPRSTVRLAGNELDYAGNAPKVSTEGSRPINGHLDNVGSLLVKVLVGREY